MGGTNPTPERMRQGGMTLVSLLPCIFLPRAPLIEIHYPTDKKRSIQQLELAKIAPIQIGNDYSKEGDENIRSS